MMHYFLTCDKHQRHQSINQSICGGGDLGGQCASNSQIHNFINPNNHFERYRPLQAVNSAQRLFLCLNFQFNLAAPRARLRARLFLLTVVCMMLVK
jgi:hypothetical protein